MDTNVLIQAKKSFDGVFSASSMTRKEIWQLADLYHELTGRRMSTTCPQCVKDMLEYVQTIDISKI